MSEPSTFAELVQSAWDLLSSSWDYIAKLDRKDKLTSFGLVVTFLFSCLNFWRTSQTNRRTRANNRAARFEAVHGPTLNEAVKELNETAREISMGRIALSSVDEARDFFRSKIRTRVIKAEHMVVNEVHSISTSMLPKDQNAWKGISSSEHWNTIENVQSKFLTADALDVALAHLDILKASLVAIATAINEVRASENDV